MDEKHLKDLAKKAQQDDVEAFGSIYDMCVQSIYRYVYFRVDSKHEAEDLTEDIFLKAFRAIGRYRHDESSVMAWLFTIARNTVIDHYRGNGRRMETPLTEELEAMLVDHVAEKDLEVLHLQADLKRAILMLTEDQHQVIVLRFIAGMSCAEVAQVLGKSEDSVKQLQHRALANLRRGLEVDEDEREQSM